MGVRVNVGDDAVDIAFTGMDRWVTLNRRGQHIAMADITSARVAPVAEVRSDTGLRVGGSYWPGRFATGWFNVKGQKGKRQLWCVYRDPEVLVIETQLDRPCRVVLQTPNRHDIAWYIGERLGR